MIDPTKTAERQYDAIAKIIEEHGFVKERIVTALRDVIAGEVMLDRMASEAFANLTEAIARERGKREPVATLLREDGTMTAIYADEFFRPTGFIPEHYTPIPAKETDQ